MLTLDQYNWWCDELRSNDAPHATGFLSVEITGRPICHCAVGLILDHAKWPYTTSFRDSFSFNEVGSDGRFTFIDDVSASVRHYYHPNDDDDFSSSYMPSIYRGSPKTKRLFQFVSNLNDSRIPWKWIAHILDLTRSRYYDPSCDLVDLTFGAEVATSLFHEFNPQERQL